MARKRVRGYVIARYLAGSQNCWEFYASDQWCVRPTEATVFSTAAHAVEHLGVDHALIPYRHAEALSNLTSERTVFIAREGNLVVYVKKSS